MSTSILFFPASMPDETLQSRISRYHMLSGNRSENETFRDIFDTAPFAMRIIPNRIDDLASRLPGDKDLNLNELLLFNTILPVYKPFLGISKGNDELRDESIISAVARIPRREVSAHSMAKICLSCVQDDLIETGHSFWHRAHHIPGVTACWRHGEELLQACPKCSHPFYRSNKLLPSLSAQCVCGWSPLSSHLPKTGLELEQNFALFAKELLDRNLPAVKSEVLAAFYTRQAKKMGFTHGQFMSRAKLFESIQSTFGPELLAKIDNAYAAGKHNQWIRTTTVNGLLDMPITRHLIMAYHLFKTVDSFEKKLATESLLFSCNKGLQTQPKAPSLSKRKLHRQKVTQLIEARPGLSLDYLWANAYQATLWLIANDKPWLTEILANGPVTKAKTEQHADRRDEEYAKIIAERVEELYNFSQKQIRVNITNMIALLPSRVPPSPADRKILFPRVAQQLEIHHESSWHFHLRRAIWALSEMSRLKLPPNTSSLQLLTSVPIQAWNALINHFEWDLEKFMSTGVNPESLLATTNVSRQWKGPPGHHGPMGGRSYIAIKSGKEGAPDYF
ncbi:TniQ family protein [Pseudomonas sp. VI4.1]|uniref:TniQ family protein n=1 Tax=Pseudomonas sp. VI4.1 TaxID=1941346 RepID=UPI0009CE2CEB|nr:TniQ family protein [Pseudomonas sp. VI4.1]OPK06018.1 transposase [Pseudomonas sp. VI4.1]